MKGGDVAIMLPGPGINASAQATISWSSAPSPNGTYDECTKSEDPKAALKTIPKVGRPQRPVFGRWAVELCVRPLTVGRAPQRPAQGFIDTDR